MATEGKGGLPFLGSGIRFDLFELDVEGGQLRRNGFPVDLSPQALKVLLLLAERPDKLVTRKKIIEALWPGQSYGDFDSRLNFTIKKLREGLGDDADQPRYIQTVRNAGYRFIAPLREPAPPPLAAIPKSDDNLLPSTSGTRPNPPQGALLTDNDVRLAVNRVSIPVLTVVLLAVTVMTALFREWSWGSGGAKPDSAPEISSVTPILPQERQRIVIRGRGFGLHVPYFRTDSPQLAIRDLTSHWAAGRIIPQNWDEVMVDVESWTDTEIVLGGFSGDYGANGWKLTTGDNLEVAVWNPQSGIGPGLYHLSVTGNELPR